MTTTRQKMLRLLHGGDPGETIVSPLIDSWIFEDSTEKVVREEDEYTYAQDVRGPVEDQLHMGEMCGYDPVALQDIDWAEANENLQWHEQAVSLDPRAKRKIDRFTLHTPFGDIVRRRESTPASARMIEESDLSVEQRHRIIAWYADEIVRSDLQRIAAQIEGYVAIRGERGLLSSAVADPFGLFGLLSPGFDSQVYHYADYPQEHRKLADRILEVAQFQADIILDHGYDFVWAGSTGGSTLSSPRYYRETQLHLAQELIRHVRRRGGLIYTHDCTRVAAMIREGVFNALCPSCLETLAPPPTGDIDDLAAYRKMLRREICTKGNIDVGFLLHASVDEVRKATLQVMEATQGYRHMVGTGDDVYFGTPIESIKAMVDVAKNYTGRFHATV